MCRDIQEHPHGIFWGLHILYQQYVYSVVFNGLCSNNMFTVLQVVLWLYMSYNLCCYIFDGVGMGKQHSMHLHSVTLSKMLRLG